jgi:hypothetical protein
VLCDQIQLEASFESVRIDLYNMGAGPSFLSEFGVCTFVETDGKTRNLEECEAILNANDKYLQSWTYWDSRFYTDDTQEVMTDVVNLFSRVYPVATNGIPQSLHYNTSTKHFSYVYDLNVTSVDQAYLPTEIYVPDHVYPLGFRVVVSAYFKWLFNRETSFLYISLNDDVLSRFDFFNRTFFHKCKVSIYSL